MNFKYFEFNRKELAGSLGDIGVFLPLALSLISLNGLNPFSLFFVGGMLYVITGIYFKHPVPVQPLKALAITSLAIGATTSLISAASILMGIFLLVFYFTGMSGLLVKIFTRPIVRGIQLGLGLMLVKKGVDLLLLKEFIIGGREWVINAGTYSIPLGLIVGGASLFLAMRFSGNKRVPASLIILSLGLLLGIITMPVDFLSGNIASALPVPTFPSISDFAPAFVLLVIPQIPLTIGNSLYATSETAKQYFGERAQKTTPRTLSLSLGIANIFAGILTGMPLCHGAGGLTAHYRFGSRTAGSNIIIGTMFVVIALLSLVFSVSFLHMVPVSILGSLLIFTGLEHAMLINDLLTDRNDLFIAVTIGSFAIVSNSLFAGCVIGILTRSWLKNTTIEKING